MRKIIGVALLCAMGALGGCYSTAAERDTVPSFRRYRGSRSAECRVPIATCGELLSLAR